jgi:2-oxoglutarate ferredoxin oxidoreductase subunit beta
VIVFSGDGDLVTIGGNHFIHAARRNIDMTVICVNNFNYGMTGGQVGATTPLDGVTTTSPYGNYEYPFNVSALAASSGAVYVARWTVLHARRLEKSMLEALRKPGFSLIEVISPCPTGFGRRHKQREGLDTLRYYREHGIVDHDADIHEAAIELGGPLIEGNFVNIDKPTFMQQRATQLERAGI